MNKYENSAFFWQKIDSLYISSEFKLIAKKGNEHSNFKHLKYPLDYGVLVIDGDEKNTFKGYCGSLKDNGVNSIVISVNILSKTIDARFLINVNEKEEEDLMRFLDQTEFQKSIIIRRDDKFPYWQDDTF